MTDTSTQQPEEGLWTRLRRRKLVQWSVAYVAGAWGLVQGIAYMRDTFGLARTMFSKPQLFCF